MTSVIEEGVKALSVRTKFKVLVLTMVNVKDYGTESFFLRTQKRYDENVQFFHATPSNWKDSWFSFYEECCVLVKCLGIDYVMPVCDRSAAVSCALSATFPRLKGPSFLGFYMTLDKTLTREYIIPSEYNIPYRSVPLSSLKDGDIAAESLPGEIGFPLVVKPSNGTASIFVSLLSTHEEFKRLTNEEAIAEMDCVMSPVTSLVTAFLDSEKYKCTPKLLLEQYVNRKETGSVICSAEALVADGKFIPWGITDNIYWKNHPMTLLASAAPSQQPAATQENIWKCLEELVQNLKPHGFDNQFLLSEMFIFPDGSVKVMEINGRLCNFLKYLYENLMDAGNQRVASINMARGRTVKSPKWLPDRYGILFYLFTCGTGKAADHLDFEAAAKYEKSHEIEIKCFEDTWIQPTGDSGFNLGFVHTYGESFEDCMLQMEAIKYELLKQPQYSPWFDSA